MCEHVPVCAHVYSCKSFCVHVHVIHACMYMCTCLCVWVCGHMWVHIAYVQVCTWVWMPVCVYTRAHTHLPVCVQFSSVDKSCLNFCHPMDCSMPATLSFTVSRSLLKLMSLGQWCHQTISSSVVPFSSCLQSFPASGSFPMSQFFASGGQSTGVSALASVLLMNIQDQFPVRLTGLISLQSKGLSRVSSSTTVWKHQFFGTQPALWSNSHIHTWLLEKP